MFIGDVSFRLFLSNITVRRPYAYFIMQITEPASPARRPTNNVSALIVPGGFNSITER